MFKFNLLILCTAIVAVGIVKAISMPNMIEFYGRFGAFMDICSEQNSVADKDVTELGNTGNVDNISESYLRCILVNLNMIHNNDTLTAADYEGILPIFVRNKEDLKELLKTKALCVNEVQQEIDQASSTATPKLFTSCLFSHQPELRILFSSYQNPKKKTCTA